MEVKLLKSQQLKQCTHHNVHIFFMVLYLQIRCHQTSGRFSKYKVHSPDNISMQLLQETAVTNKASLHQRKLPKDWKITHVFLIFMKGSHKCPANNKLCHQQVFLTRFLNI